LGIRKDENISFLHTPTKIEITAATGVSRRRLIAVTTKVEWRVVCGNIHLIEI
jgi:hypothetical protein